MSDARDVDPDEQSGAWPRAQRLHRRFEQDARSETAAPTRLRFADGFGRVSRAGLPGRCCWVDAPQGDGCLHPSAICRWFTGGRTSWGSKAQQ